jgi:response regulator RpfG family c-di-GMP phosphodiesterase
MGAGNRLGERLVQAGLITPEAVAQALELQKRAGGRIGDCMVELRLISEQALLRFLAAEFGTKFVSGEKLSKVKVEPNTLDKIPIRMAEKMGILPINWDKDRKVLSVVMAEPQDTALVEELKIVAGATEVVTYIALRSAINAGIKKFYYGDPSAFALMAAGDAQAAKKDLAPVADLYEKPRTNSQARVPLEPPEVAPGTSPGQRQSSIAVMAAEGKPLTVTGSGNQPTSVRRAMDAIQRMSVMSDNDYIETLNVLVSLLEMQGTHKGHSARVAKQARTVAQRLGQAAREVNFITIAAYLHELGKPVQGHHTLLAAHASTPHRELSKRYLKAPLKLLETVHLPAQVSTILVQIFEAFDGSGHPQGVKGEEIALGARVLAAVDSYEDLVANPSNFTGTIQTKVDAIDKLMERSGTLFDPTVLDVLKQISTGEILRQRLLADGHQVLLAEPDPVTRTSLTRVLAAAGLTVHAVANSELALQHASAGDADLVIAATSLQPDDAFVLTAELRQEPLTAGLPVLLISDTDDPKLIDRAGQLGVSGILLRPVDEEQLATQARTLLDERLQSGAPHRPVSGSLDELPLTELLKILAQGQRSGQLVVRNDQEKGELYLEKGRLVHGICGAEKGREAIDKVLGFAAGDFRLDPNFLILEQQVDLDIAVVLRERGARSRAAGR